MPKVNFEKFLQIISSSAYLHFVDNDLFDFIVGDYDESQTEKKEKMLKSLNNLFNGIVEFE